MLDQFFYHVFDLNQDRLICEADLFNLAKNMKTQTGVDLLFDDLMILLKRIKVLQLLEGKKEPGGAKRVETTKLLKNAKEKNQIFEREDANEEVRLFLKEVAAYQDFFRVQKKMISSNLRD